MLGVGEVDRRPQGFQRVCHSDLKGRHQLLLWPMQSSGGRAGRGDEFEPSFASLRASLRNNERPNALLLASRRSMQSFRPQKKVILFAFVGSANFVQDTHAGA